MPPSPQTVRSCPPLLQPLSPFLHPTNPQMEPRIALSHCIASHSPNPTQPNPLQPPQNPQANKTKKIPYL
ncbi:uncharacterized protein BP01DRAFT_353461 [Aspergillus saccharolyticus JOP 1030-1]|uniref:Uncharacterized protein n=1 Tax=Aspergillus saccharolyticus JOP 1030-1 TaxID=1450539 RepID=A0A318ZL58_9EURO|nr:hypothetical protein BP01DRAFT_353461 [Aspergillus saccharolyticus JOP 1030-1]PYH48319.1 hypothetical protein BP01DRAFT_353461 [Aspergillus saccharolyticus JOP 1030-1]